MGAMKEPPLAGAPCDLRVLAGARISAQADEGRLDGRTGAALERVHTGVALRSGEPAPGVSTPEAQKALPQDTSGLCFRDAVRSAAGMHFASVLRQWGLLPLWCELATNRTAAVCTQAAAPALATQRLAALAGANAQALRTQGSFES